MTTNAHPLATRRWYRTAGEGLVIVLSILLAFSLDAWWDRWQNDAELQEMLVLLDAELAANERVLSSSIEVHRAISEAADSATAASFGFPNAIIPVEKFDATTGALETLLATGMLQQIADPQLRVMIVSWSGFLTDLAEKEARASERREMIRNRLAGLGANIGGPRVGGPRLPVDHPMWSDMEVVNLITMRGTEEMASIEAGQALLEHIRRIRVRLEWVTQ